MASGTTSASNGEHPHRRRPHRTSQQKETRRVQDDEDDPLPGESEEAPPVRVRDVFGGLFNHHHEGASADVEHYIHDKSFRSRLVLLSLRNSKIGIRMLLARSLVTLLGCILYVVEASYFDYFRMTGYYENETAGLSQTEQMREEVKALVLLNDKPWWLWVLQVFIASLVFIAVGFKLYITSAWSWKKNALTILDLSTSVQILIPLLYLITVLYPPLLKDLFIPLFLFCWPTSETLIAASIQLTSRSLATRPSQFRGIAIKLAVFMVSFVFSWVCVIHHFARIDNHLTLFETLWFLMVTLTTVGYGDISPAHWTGRILVMVFILSAFAFVVPLVEQLHEAFQMRQKLSNSVSYAHTGRSHVVICSTELKPLVLRDLLTEFYSDPCNSEVHCVVLVEKELGHISQLYLSHPVWSRRITVLIGTPMKPSDLVRARAQSAIACFIHTPRYTLTPDVADHHTILCAWAIKDYAPDCKLFVQILQPESKLHLTVADHVVCEGELKCALLANNSHCPGIATLLILLLHTFKPEKRNLSSEDYQLYSKCAPCEVYDSKLGKSKYFHHFVGKNFLYTAVVAYRKYHVTLIGVRSASEKEMKLNPGVNHIMHEDDICYYIGFTKEEYSKVREREAPAVHNALWQACASAAVMAMSTSGIDPMLLDDKNESAYPLFHSKLTNNSKSSMGTKKESKSSVGEKLHVPNEYTPVVGKLDGHSERRSSFPALKKSLSHDSVHDHRRPSLARPTSHSDSLGGDSILSHDPHHEARRGLQLLRFHSRVDIHSKPVVKVSLKHESEDRAISPSELSALMEEVEVATITEESLGGLRMADISADTQEKETVIDLSDHCQQQQRMSPTKLIVQKALSVPDSDTEAATSRRPMKRGAMLYSSELSLLHTPSARPISTRTPPEGHAAATDTHQRFIWPSVLHRSSISNHNNNNQPQQPTDWASKDEVVLELEDLAEEEELEELEDGHCGCETDGGPSGESYLSPDSESRLTSYRCGILPVSPYCGFQPAICHLVKNKRSSDQLKFLQQEDPPSHWKQEAVIAYCEECSDELYHFILPLRAHYLSSKSLKPLVIMFPSEPSDVFLEIIAWLPMVYYTVGKLPSVSDWLQAGILKADTVVVFSEGRLLPNEQRLPSDHPEHMVDAATILTVQKLSKLFPNVNIITEIAYRYNMRFMRFTASETYSIRNLAAIARRTDHLTYLFVPQFVSGRIFCTSMLDTLLYQTYAKPYLVDLVRQLLGCKQVQDSGFLWKVYLTEDLLQLHTYDRLFQRLASTLQEVPLGIYRTVPVTACPELTKIYDKDALDEAARINHFLNSRAASLGLSTTVPVEMGLQCQSFVLINPPPKTELRANDIILVLRSANASATATATAAGAHMNNSNTNAFTAMPSSHCQDCGLVKPPLPYTPPPTLILSPPPTQRVPVECHV